jgi:hypothetical protein
MRDFETDKALLAKTLRVELALEKTSSAPLEFNPNTIELE